MEIIKIDDLLATDESDAANSDTFIVGSVIQTLL
jgi:hypothetical protein